MTDTTDPRLWIRKISVLLVEGGKILDLSNLHVKFTTSQADTESPNNCTVRLYNMKDDTLLKVSEYSTLILQAGYESQFGVIFQGTVIQYRVGRENAKDSYLDILAADGDLGYNSAIINTTLEKGAKPSDVINAAIGSMASKGITSGYVAAGTGGILPRGKVMFGMSRDFIRQGTKTVGATWSIQNGKINIIPLDSYMPGEAIVLNAGNGLIGIPEQTQQGINAKCLLNPRLNVGSAVQIDNKSINQLVQRDPDNVIPYNQWAGIQLLAKVRSDGLYRMFVVEHEGDTRGQAWYSRLTCLAIDRSTGTVKPYG